MFRTALRVRRAAPTKKCTTFVPVSRRAVTTDAASSHAEKGDVPAVSDIRMGVAVLPGSWTDPVGIAGG